MTDQGGSGGNGSHDPDQGGSDGNGSRDLVNSEKNNQDEDQSDQDGMEAMGDRLGSNNTDCRLFEDVNRRRTTQNSAAPVGRTSNSSDTKVPNSRTSRKGKGRASVMEGLDLEGVVEAKCLHFVTLGKDSETVWKVIAYNTSRLLRFPFLPWVGTVFSIDRMIWLFELALIFLSATVVGLCYAMGYSEVNVDGYKEFTGYLNTICPFLVGLYIREVLARWWELRLEIMEFHSAIYDICMHFATSGVPRRRYERTVRYGLVAQILLFQVARKEIDLSVLEDKKLVTKSERIILAAQSGNISQVLWVWLSQDTLDLMRSYRLAFPKLCFESCERGRRSFSKIAMTLTTPLPFAYIHIISLIVFFNNVAGAFRCGFVIFNSMKDWKGLAVPFAEVMFLVIPPLLYQGCLHIGQILENPFEDEVLNFPLGVYHTTVARNSMSIFEAAQKRREEEEPAEKIHNDSKISTVVR